MYLLNSNKKGISSIELSKYIEVTQKTAWFMLQRIRVIMNAQDGKFNGIYLDRQAYVRRKES